MARPASVLGFAAACAAAAASGAFGQFDPLADEAADAPLIGSILDLPVTEEDEIELIPVSATMRALDKISARFTDIEMKIDEPSVFGTLEVVVRTCATRPPEEPPETSAFVQIYDYGLDGMAALQAGEEAEKERVFSGWMFASSPALNPLEHPVYDVWVIDCKMRAPSQ